MNDGHLFSFHGGGCYFEYEGKNIDVDFGPADRCDGFSKLKLYNFMLTLDRLSPNIFNLDCVQEGLEELESKSEINKPGRFPNPDLYYLTANFSAF